MKRSRLWKLARRKARPLEALAELADAAADAPVDLKTRILGVSGLALGRVGMLDEGAETIRRALDLANADGNHRRGRRLLGYLDTLGDLQPPFRLPKPSRTDRQAARVYSDRVRQAVELPVITATTCGELEDLDELRYAHPEAALCRLLPAADRLPLALAAPWLAVTGSAYRLRAGQREETDADLRRAEQHLQAALWAAQAAGDVAGQADALQRLGYVLADRGEHRQALELAERATGIFSRLADLYGKGRGLIDQALWLWHLGHRRITIRVVDEALPLLQARSAAADRYRAAAFQLRGACFQRLGDLKQALEDLYRAVSALRGDSALPMKARILCLRAAIRTSLENLDGAARDYWKALEILRTVHYADAALATVELVRVLILQGRHDEARRTALSVRQLVIPLHRNPHVSAAIAELIRGGQSALTLARVERVRATLEQARTRSDWRTLKVRSSVTRRAR